MATSRYAKLLAGAASIAASLGIDVFRGITSGRIQAKATDLKVKREIAAHNAEIEDKRQAKKARKAARV